MSRSAVAMIAALEAAEMRATAGDARRVLRDERLGLMAALQRPRLGSRPVVQRAYDVRTGRTTAEQLAAEQWDRAAAEAAKRPSIGALVVEAERVLAMWEGL